MVMAIMGKKNIHLVESDYKKCIFLKEIAMLTETDIIIHNCRIEDLSFINADLITCRALASLSKLIDYVEVFINKSLGENHNFPKLLFLKAIITHRAPHRLGEKFFFFFQKKMAPNLGRRREYYGSNRAVCLV